MTRKIAVCSAVLALVCSVAPAVAGAAGDSYAVVVSKATAADAAWKPVADALLRKHGGRQIVYESDLNDALPELKAFFPRYTCFVARPEEVTRPFVGRVHDLVSRYDDDPYADTFWGILTGYDASNALAIATRSEPLTVHKVAAATEIALEMVEEGGWYDELVAGKKVWKEKGAAPAETKGADDSTHALADCLTQWNADLFVTSGHASERDWQLGYRYRNGFFKSQAGQMYGLDTQGERFAVKSDHPRVYLPVGNCLMGHITGPDSMALAWMNGVGVMQMIGYQEPTWFGYMGWGMLDMFVEQPGRYTLAEAFIANHHALNHELRRAPSKGLEFDRDVVAFYGDPRWEARMASGPCAWEQTLTEEKGVFTLTVLPRRGEKTFEAINKNGSQRGGRPLIQFLPHRVKKVKILEGEDLKPVITDDFVLVPNPGSCDPQRVYRVRFEAEKAVAGA